MKNSFQEITQTETPWIAPSILSCNFLEMGKELDAIEEAGADFVHLDIMDDHFVPNISFGPAIVKHVAQKTQIPMIAHLMIDNPLKYARIFYEMNVFGISFHIEAVDNYWEVIDGIKSLGMQAAIAIKPSTEIKEAEKLVEKCDFILIMSVEPGYSGQSFMEVALPKIENLRKISEKMNKSLPIEVDGGINSNTARLCRDAGANILVSASYIFKSKDYKKAIESLRG
ncbi:MAG: ribulose-phosphate 3-epimerase [Candidatus Zixiibacteriota bacterium]